MNIFGLKQVVITDDDGTDPVALPAGMILHVSEVYDNAEFLAEGRRVAARALLTGLEWELEAGGISLDAWAKITGASITAQTLPQAQGGNTYTLSRDSAASPPYVRVYGRSIGDDGQGDVWVKLYRAKITALEGTMREGEFLITACRGVAVFNSSGALYDVVEHQYAVAI